MRLSTNLQETPCPGLSSETRVSKPFYKVKLLGSDGKLTDHHIDANSGVGDQKRHSPDRELLHQPEAGGRDRRAEGGGKAAEAEVEREAGSVQYKITVTTGSQSQEVRIGADGKVMPSR